MSNVLRSREPCAPDRKPLRVMVVDDAVVVRSLLARWVDAEPDMAVVASLRTGREAVTQIERNATPTWSCSTSTCRSSTASRRCRCCCKKSAISSSSWCRRSRAAAPKSACARWRSAPRTTSRSRRRAREATTSVEFHRELIEKIRTLGRRRPRRAPMRGRQRR